MFTTRQAQMQAQLLDGLNLPLDLKSRLSIIQSLAYINSPVEIDDLCVGVMATLGQLIAKIGELRGLKPQEITIDRRHASLMLNSIAYHFQNGWQFDIGPVHTAINNFYETKDKRWIFYNGAYQHLRDGLLNFLNTPNNAEAIAKATKNYRAQELEDAIAKLGLCAAIARSR